MPEPLNLTPYPPTHTPIDSDESSARPSLAPLECRARSADVQPNPVAEGGATEMLIERYRNQGNGGAGNAPAPPSAGKSCFAPLLGAVGSCGVLVGSQGTTALVLGSSCVASTLALIDCLADAKRPDTR